MNPNLDSRKVLEWFKAGKTGQAPRIEATGLDLASNPDLDQAKTVTEQCNIVVVTHDGAWREEIEIEMRNEDGESYIGTVTMTEAKHGIFRDCLGFTDFKNFDGVRFSFKGIRIVTFKLKEQIDINKLIEKQHFDFKRTFKRNGKMESSVIKCKIRGLRSEAFKEHLARKEAMKNDHCDDGSIFHIIKTYTK